MKEIIVVTIVAAQVLTLIAQVVMYKKGKAEAAILMAIPQVMFLLAVQMIASA